MPKVPTAQEAQRLRPQNPTGLGRTPGMGDAVKGFGQSLQQLAEIEKRKDAADKKLDLARFQADYNSYLKQLDNDVKKRNTGNLSPTEYVKENSTRWFEENRDNYRSDLSKEIGVAKTQLDTSQFTVTAGDERALSSSNLMAKIDYTISKAAEEVGQNPSLIDKKLVDLSGSLGKAFKDLDLDQQNPVATQLRLRQMNRQLIKAAANGYALDGSPDKAGKLLERYRTQYESETEFFKAYDEVVGRAYRAFDKKLRMEDRIQKRLADKQKRDSIAELTDLVLSMEDNEDLVDVQHDDYTSKQLLGQGDLSIPDYLKYQKQLRIEKKELQLSNSNVILSDIIKPDSDLDVIEEKIHLSRSPNNPGGPQITQGQAQSLLNKLRTIRNARQNIDGRQLTMGLNILRAEVSEPVSSYDTDPLAKKDRNEKRVRRAHLYLYNLLAEGKADFMTNLTKARNEFSLNSQMIGRETLPGAPKGVQTLEQGKIQLENLMRMHSDGIIDKDMYIKRSNALHRKMESIRKSEQQDKFEKKLDRERAVKDTPFDIRPER